MSRWFSVPGKPVPQGSMRAFAVKGKAFTTDSNPGPLAMYRNDIMAAYEREYGNEPMYLGPIEVYITFTFKRPGIHFNASGKLKDSTYAQPAPRWVTKKPDLDKLCRAVLDALSGYAYDDDVQVVSINAVKVWACPEGDCKEGTAIRISELPDLP